MYNYDNWIVSPDSTEIESDTLADSPLISVTPDPETYFPTANILKDISVPLSPASREQTEQIDGNQIFIWNLTYQV